MTRVIAFFIAFFAISTAKADCLACWELRKVKIILTTGDSLTGFVQWNEIWVGSSHQEWAEWKNRFPESLLHYYESLSYPMKILVHTQLIPIKNDSFPYEFISTKQEYLLELEPEQIKSIFEMDKEAKKYAGAGPVPLFTQEQIEMLNTNPFATYTQNISVADDYFFSYNPEITREQLMQIPAQLNGIPELQRLARVDEFQKKGVIIFTISYD